MSSVWDYPITQPFGYDPTYPLNGGNHRGVDWGCPTGTPVVVNGMTIGLSGATGAVTGPHCHVGKFVGGTAVDPGRGGSTLPGAVVDSTGYDATNGNYVRINSGGALWVYLHLSKIMVSNGQKVEGYMASTLGRTEVNDLSIMAFGYPASEADYAAQVGKESNDRIRWYFASPSFQAHMAQVAEWQRKADLYDAGQGGEYVKVTDLYIKK